MFLLAWRQFMLDPLRSALTAIALGTVIAVILIIVGFEQGQYHQLKQVVLNREASLIATQPGVNNFIAVRSSLPQLSRMEVENIDGVVNAHPLTAIPIIYSKDNMRTPVYVLVYDSKGGPSTIIEGQAISDGRHIVIDYSLAKKYNLEIGDSFLVSDFEFRIVGLTQESAFMMPFAFINYDGMIDLFLESEIAPDLSTFPLLSYMLLELDPSANSQVVMTQIEKHVSSVDILTAEQLAQNDKNMGEVFYGPIIGLLVSVGYIIGILVVGLIMYADIRGRIKSFAVLKALGFSNKKLILAVFQQSLLLLAIAIPLSIVFSMGLSIFIETVSPVYLIRLFDPVSFTQTLISSVGFAIIGGLIPVRSVLGTDPMLAFQGE